jgi:hypothetical protein
MVHQLKDKSVKMPLTKTNTEINALPPGASAGDRHVLKDYLGALISYPIKFQQDADTNTCQTVGVGVTDAFPMTNRRVA